MLLDKDGDDQLARSCEKGKIVTKSQGREEYPTYNKKNKANWIGHILRRNCLLKHITEGKKEVRIEVKTKKKM